MPTRQFGSYDIEVDRDGHLADASQWTPELAQAIAHAVGVGRLSARHWDVINYLREEYFENRENQPNTRAIIKAMSDAWGEKIKQGDLYDLFPMDPSKQGGRIAGLPESKRKGGY